MSFGFAAMLATAFFSFEILYSRKLGVKFHLKRFVGRITIMLLGVILLIVLVDLVSALHLTSANGAVTLSVSVILWSSVWLILVAVWRYSIEKMLKGQW
jgi:hypothetical protein